MLSLEYRLPLLAKTDPPCSYLLITVCYIASHYYYYIFKYEARHFN